VAVTLRQHNLAMVAAAITLIVVSLAVRPAPASAALSTCQLLAADPRCALSIYPALQPDQQQALDAIAAEDQGFPIGTPPAPDNQDPGSDIPINDPDLSPVFGIAAGGGPPASGLLFQPSNRWTGVLPGSSNVTTVWAGANGVDPTIGMVWVGTYDPTGIQLLRSYALTAPIHSGSLTISAVDGVGNLTLQGATSGLLGFIAGATHLVAQ